MTLHRPVPPIDLSSATRDWALWMTRQPTVTGSEGERTFSAMLAERIRQTPALAGAETWLIEAQGDVHGRSCCAVLVRGEGPQTVLLTGHFDTVTVEDFGDLAPLATDPEALLPALQERLKEAGSDADRLARDDFASGDYLPGRGLLDMKAGLAAGLAALEAFASASVRKGNLLFVAVPDEEVNSVGARALAAAMPRLQQERGLEIIAAINLDCIGDRGDGADGRSVALGSVGKLLVTAYVAGEQSHASHPFQGVNAGAIAAVLAHRLEWAPELADGRDGSPGIPPTLLSLKDSKEQYDVTTPASVFATWNVLSQGRDAQTTLAKVMDLVERTLRQFECDLGRRRMAVDGADAPKPLISLLTSQELFSLLDPDERAKVDEEALRIAKSAISLPDQCRSLTDIAWRLSRRRGPAVVIGFGSLPYPPVSLSDEPRAGVFRAAIDAARRRAADWTGQPIKLTPFFPGISDVSFVGEANAADAPLIAANTPAWRHGVRWGGEVGGVPTVNIGPWGRDYHTPIERLYTPYAFGVLPAFLLDICLTTLASPRP